MSSNGACNCDEVKALQSELAELRAAAYPVLAWVARNGGGRAAVERLEQALANGREVEPGSAEPRQWPLCNGCGKPTNGRFHECPDEEHDPCCRKCTPGYWGMLLCSQCGNKRCPRASNHDLACTNSNEPGQAGSIYA